MRLTFRRLVIATCAACAGLPLVPESAGAELDVSNLPAVVVKTVPESGATDVTPGVVEIRVTFSKAMSPNRWSFFSATEPYRDDQYASKPRFEPDHRTFVIQVNTKPGKAYAFWVNNARYQNFRDASGAAPLPYLVAFRTKAQ